MAAISSSSRYSSSHSEADTQYGLDDASVVLDGLINIEKSGSGSAHFDSAQTGTGIHQASQSQVKRRSARLSSTMDSNKLSERYTLEETGEADLIVSTVHRNEHIIEETDQIEAHPALELPTDPLSSYSVPTVTSLGSSSHLIVYNASSLNSDSESDIDGEHVLQPSSSVDSTSSLGSPHGEEEEVKNFQQTSPALHTPPRNSEELASAISPQGLSSQLPDLISFELLTVPQPIPAQQQPDLTPRNPSTSSCVTVDELLSLSPLQSSSSISIPPSSQSQHHKAEVPNIVEDAVTFPSLILNPEAVPQDFKSSREQKSSLSVAEQDSTIHSREHSPSPMERQSDMVQSGIEFIAEQDETTTANIEAASTTPVMNVDKLLANSPKKLANPFNPTGETRKRSPTKTIKGKQKALEGDRSMGDLPSNTPDDANTFESNGVVDSDRVIKKERRSKAKLRDIERTRQQLLSLSPTSADVLNLLASPERGDSPMSTPRFGVDTAASEFVNASDVEAGPLPGAPTTPRKAASRALALASPRRPQDTPLRFISPAPIALDDPSRAPARRILVSPEFRPNPRPLPLDDPSRTPARRIPVIKSPDKPLSVKGASMPQLRIEQSSPVRRSVGSPSKLAPMPTSLSHATSPSFSSASSSMTNRLAKPLFFPVQSNATLDDSSSTSGIPNYRLATESTHAKNAPPSNLRQPSATTAGKISRITAKPYLRPPKGSSRLPTAASTRRSVSTISNGSFTATINGAIPSATQPSSANLAPSRIPSPVKRPTLNVDPSRDGLTIASPPASTSALGANGMEVGSRANSVKRKRERMMEEDETDQPPVKRSVLTIRPVVKGMYSKALARHRVADGSSAAATEKIPSPLRPSRPPGPVQFRPVIPGTLRRFEIKGNSSKDFFKEKDETSEADVLSPEPPSVSIDGPSRQESPLIETDTASTVTTLSREPTLDDMASPPNLPRSETLVLSSRGPGAGPRRTTRSRNVTRPLTTNFTSKRNPSSAITTTIHPRAIALSKVSAKVPARLTTPTGGIPTNPKQLQSLTEANTMHNQAYIADLQRKVVRKYGPRPASPTTKVKTILEKSKEERVKEREARAKRRRQRDQSTSTSSDNKDDSQDKSVDAFSSPISCGPMSDIDPPTKHVRGPGDEEDYETPIRSPKLSRWDPNKVAKNVKWDRALARSISEHAAEQLVQEANAKAEADSARKGCLARDPAIFCLDPLGNVPDANTPLEDLGRERIIVTRFVYDDDVEATEAARPAKRRKT